MPGFFSMLNATANSLEAQRYGLDVVGQNIANVNTPGYTRRVVDLEAIPPYDPGSAGGGVNVQGTRSQRDRLLERRLWTEVPGERRASAQAEALGLVEAALGTPGSGLAAKLASFFDAFATLADQPTSATARQQVVTDAQSLVAEFHTTVDRLEEATRDADRGIRGAVDEINNLASRVAALNEQIAKANGSTSVLHLQDEQRLAVRRLAELADVQVIEREDGGVDVTIGRGRPLVIAQSQFQLSVASLAPSGYADIVSGGSSITAEIMGGRIGGLRDVRDTSVPAYLADLDAIAYEITTQVNAIHATGFDLSGAAGGAFFQPLGAAAGAASAIGVDTTLAASPSKIVAAGIAAPGDNQVARTLAALRDSRVLNGNTATFGDAWGQLVYRVGSDTRGARSAADSGAEIVRQVEAMQDAVSGVSIDEEAAMMLRFQRAYEANARFFNVVDESLQVLLNLGR